MKRIADHPNDQIREHYKHVPPYLRDLLMMCSYGYTAYPSCYVQLVRALLAEEPSDVLFLVLNYDDLLEQALYQFPEGTIRFESVDDYVRADRATKVIKLHGSINWFKPIGSASAVWKTLVRTIDVLAKPSHSQIHVAAKYGKSDQSRTYQLEIAGQRGYPVLTAPLAGKGATAMVCPATHLETTREFLRDCSRFLIIGCSGLDDDLLDLLGKSVKKRSPWVQVVSGSAAQGEEAFQRFASKVSAFGGVKSPAGQFCFEGGFKEYMASDWPIRFLRE